MKKQDVSTKKLDLDAALEEIAKKLRPAANAPWIANSRYNSNACNDTAPGTNGACIACSCCSSEY